MYPEMLYDGEKPKDPVTLDLYPFGASGFSLYEDDGVTQEYRQGAFARTRIEVQAPKSLDVPGGIITVKVGAAEGRYDGMPDSRAYLAELHIPARPASVRLGDQVLPEITTAATGRNARNQVRAGFEAAEEGWYFDPSDRKGVLHVKFEPQALAAGFTLTVVLQGSVDHDASLAEAPRQHSRHQHAGPGSQ
jgi:alpha-glucosidase